MYKSLLARALTFALVLLLPIALIAEGSERDCHQRIAPGIGCGCRHSETGRQRR